MELLDNISGITNKITTIKEQIEDLIPQFEAFIVDQNIPLEVRWDVWCSAPPSIKKHNNWIYHFETLPEDVITYDGIYHAERYTVIHLVDVVDRLEEYMEDIDSGAEWLDEDNNYLKDHDFDLEKFKEEILENNIGSFTYDW